MATRATTEGECPSATRSRERATRCLRWVGPGRGGGLLAAPFPWAALRTGRARCRASGSPRACRCSCGGLARLPRCRDPLASVAVADDPHAPRVVEREPGAGRPPAGEVAASQPAPVRLRVFPSQPTDHPPPGVGVEVAEGLRGNAVLEVGAPAPQHRVEPGEELVERLLMAGRGDLLHLRRDALERTVGRIGVDSGPELTSPAALDPPAEEVEALVEMG